MCCYANWAHALNSEHAQWKTWDCCKTLMLECLTNDPNYVCALGCWEKPNLSPGLLKRTLSHIFRTEHHRTHIRCWNSLFPQTWWIPVAVWMKACLKTNWSSVKRTNLHLMRLLATSQSSTFITAKHSMSIQPN